MTSPNGTRVSSIVEWARSWKVKDRDPFCWDYCKGNCPTCDESRKEIYGGDEYCGLISKAPGGPFRECHSKVSPEDVFDSCIYDVCLNGGAKNILCQALEAYAAICKKQGITVYDWRTPSGCGELGGLFFLLTKAAVRLELLCCLRRWPVGGVSGQTPGLDPAPWQLDPMGMWAREVPIRD